MLQLSCVLLQLDKHNTAVPSAFYKSISTAPQWEICAPVNRSAWLTAVLVLSTGWCYKVWQSESFTAVLNRAHFPMCVHITFKQILLFEISSYKYRNSVYLSIAMLLENLIPSQQHALLCIWILWLEITRSSEATLEHSLFIRGRSGNLACRLAVIGNLFEMAFNCCWPSAR